MNNFLQDITKNISSLFKNTNSNSVIGVDIGSSSIKIVQLKNENGIAVLETYGSVSFGSYVQNSYVGQAVNPSHDQTIQAINDLIKEANITTLSSAVSIPSASSLVFLLELPATVPEKDFANVIPLEARRYIPVPMTEVSIDWWVVPHDEVFEGNEDSEENQQIKKIRPVRVLVAAIHNEALKRFQEVVKDAKLSSDFFEIEMFSNVRSCIGKDLSTVALVDFGAAKTKVTVVYRGILQDFHIVNRGSQDLTRVLSTGLNIPILKAEELKKKHGLLPNDDHKEMGDIISSSLEYTVAEINNIILSYEKKYSQSIDKIMLTGGGSALPGLVEFMSSKLPAPVSRANPFSHVKSPAFLEPILADVGPEFGVALGLAMRKLSS
jgi:type IV pilus assembly protein PilM